MHIVGSNSLDGNQTYREALLAWESSKETEEKKTEQENDEIHEQDKGDENEKSE